MHLSDISEPVEMQSYIDSEWEKHRQDNPADSGEPESVRRACWSRTTYWTVHRRLLMKKALEESSKLEEIEKKKYENEAEEEMKMI